jgi:hypothetical protein
MCTSRCVAPLVSLISVRDFLVVDGDAVLLIYSRNIAGLGETFVLHVSVPCCNLSLFVGMQVLSTVQRCSWLDVGAKLCRFSTCRILCKGVVLSLGLGLGGEVLEAFLGCRLIDLKLSSPKLHRIYSGYQV